MRTAPTWASGDVVCYRRDFPMPLKLVRAPDTDTLWDTCVGRFLDELGDNPGPSGFGSYLWTPQNRQVDLLCETAVERGLPGWLGPPITTLRDLGKLFDLRMKRVGLLTRRRLISRVAARVASDVGMTDPTHTDGVVRGHMLDALFGELLPEGISPERLRQALDGLGVPAGLQAGGDDFSRHRNAWIVGSYAGYLNELNRLERIDQRQAWARVADRIDIGELPEVLNGASRLHLYGLYMMRSRQRLLGALARQSDVQVSVYVLAEPEESEWSALTDDIEDVRLKEPIGGTERGLQEPLVERIPWIQPTPDTQREIEWVAREVKKLVVEKHVEPHRIAVIARSGHEDSGRMHRALAAAGVTATTIVRSKLTEIAALKALLLLFRGAPRGWSYRALRSVLDHPYFDIDIDLRSIDFIAMNRRVDGLDTWEGQLQRLIGRLQAAKQDDADRATRRYGYRLRDAGVWLDRVELDLAAFGAIRATLEQYAAPRPEKEWIELTLAALRGTEGLAFGLRARLCKPVGGRWDVVRLDQRGLVQIEKLLREWLDLDHPPRPLAPLEWLTLLQRLLEANELSISTPAHKGVQVLEAHDAALTPFDHVFVVHANDGVFPRPVPSGGVLSNDERARLRAAPVNGIPLGHRDLELRRERTLWRAVTSSGQVRISYRTADPTGTPLLPSLMVPAHDPSTELPRTHEPQDDDRFTPVTAAQANRLAAQTLRDFVVGDHLEGELEGDLDGEAAPEIHPGTPDLIPFAVVAAVAETHRDTGAEPLEADHPAFRPNPWNGWLRDPRLHELLAKRFSDDYPWSASALETYSKCPFEYLVGRVLNLEEVKEVEEETTPLVFGSVAHDLLEHFYRRVKDDLPASFNARAEAALNEAANVVLAERHQSDEWLGSPLLWEQGWERIRGAVRRYLVWELELLHAKGEMPELLEYVFGYGDASVFVRGKDVTGHPAVLRILGRIDRVDRTGSGHNACYQVLDYKSGKMPASTHYVDGTALQAPLYMRVLEDEGRNVTLGYYRSLKKVKKPMQYGGKIKRSQSEYDDALRFALSIPRRIRAGLFEPTRSMKGGGWPLWAPGRDVTRSQAELAEGNRYEDVTPLSPEPAPAVSASKSASAPGVDVEPSAGAALLLPFGAPDPIESPADADGASDV